MLDFVTPVRRDGPDPGTGPIVSARVTVVVVTGYLGSGKTTLIAGLIGRPEMAGTAVIVNELAAAGIDRSILADAGAGDVVQLSNGCLCCAAGTDLAKAVARLIGAAVDRGAPLARILIETSGAADPGPILRQVCFNPGLRPHVRYGGVLTLFDAEHGADALARDPVGYAQIGLADTILVTKTDRVNTTAAAEAEDLLRSLNPSAAVTRDRDEVGRFVITAGRGSGTLAWLGPATETTESSHRQMLSTWSIVGDSPVRWSRAEQAIRVAFDRRGNDVLRTKGLIWTDDDCRPLVIHGIGRSFHRPVRLKTFEGRPTSRIAVIGFAGAEPLAEAIAAAVCGHITGTTTPKSE